MFLLQEMLRIVLKDFIVLVLYIQLHYHVVDEQIYKALKLRNTIIATLFKEVSNLEATAWYVFY